LFADYGMLWNNIISGLFFLDSKNNLTITETLFTNTSDPGIGISSFIGGVTTEYWDKYYDTAKRRDPHKFNELFNNHINCADLVFTKNIFRDDNPPLISFNVKSQFASLEENSGHVNLIFIPSSFIEKEFSFKKNSIQGYIDLGDLLFPENSVIDLKSIEKNIAVTSSYPVKLDLTKIPSNYHLPPMFSYGSNQEKLKRFYIGDDYDNLLSKDDFDKLMFVYKKINDSYLYRGNRRETNFSFVAMKDLEGKRLRSEYLKYRGLKNWTNYNLNRLMKVYTNQGTDPAEAIVISIWVVFFFGIFYFFFPSDWDVASKSKLISNFKDFVEKNEKGYVKPFVSLSIGFIISLINAFTLSLNSFTTLGFGNIPTHGIARYICIIQGFIGWFLLSIFTVALINQVL